MKYFRLITIWVGVFSSILLYNAENKADPTDDFSFSLMYFPEANVYKLMTHQAVTDVFRDRLDFFPATETAKLATHLITLCHQYRFDPAFILSLIEVESSFRINVISPAGAVGLMQVMPATASVITHNWAYVGNHTLTDAYTNLSVGIAYLAWLRTWLEDRHHSYSPFYLLIAYNAGPSKMNDLILRKAFKPVKTKKYFEMIRRMMPEFRFYGAGGKLSV